MRSSMVNERDNERFLALRCPSSVVRMTASSAISFWPSCVQWECGRRGGAAFMCGTGALIREGKKKNRP